MKPFVRKFFASAILSAGFVCAPEVHAADLTTMAPGSLHTNVVSIGKKQIPLPTGRWELKFSSTLPETGARPQDSTQSITIILVQQSGTQYTGATVIRTNDRPADGQGWPRPTAICDRKNVHFNVSDKTYDRTNADCWQVNHFVNTYTAAKNPVYNRLKRWARRTTPTNAFLALQYVVNDGYEILRVAYIINPTAFGFPAYGDKEWTASQWHRNFIGGHAESEKAIELLRNTGEKIHTLIRRGFRNELAEYKSDFQLRLRP